MKITGGNLRGSDMINAGGIGRKRDFVSFLNDIYEGL
jgi:hypothetical protein